MIDIRKEDCRKCHNSGLVWYIDDYDVCCACNAFEILAVEKAVKEGKTKRTFLKTISCSVKEVLEDSSYANTLLNQGFTFSANGVADYHVRSNDVDGAFDEIYRFITKEKEKSVYARF